MSQELLALLPYVASGALYFAQYHRFFETPHQIEPEGWQLDLIGPLFVAAVTPLAVVAGFDVVNDAAVALISACAVSIVISVVLFAITSGINHPVMLQRPSAFGFELVMVTWSRVLLVLGECLTVGCGIITVLNVQ